MQYVNAPEDSYGTNDWVILVIIVYTPHINMLMVSLNSNIMTLFWTHAQFASKQNNANVTKVKIPS